MRFISQNYKFVEQFGSKLTELITSWPHVHGHKCLDDDATENANPHLQLHVFCGVVAFAASQKCQCTGLKELNAPLSAFSW